jgi:hypothetical protein
MPLLTDFALRLAFGLALAMGITSPARVTSGYFRNHSYVLLGLNVLAMLGALTDRERFAIWLPLAAGIVAYLAIVAWLYEKPRAGIVMLWCVAALDLSACWFHQQLPSSASPLAAVLWILEAPTAGLLLGGTLAAMFLGHWYLNTPTMEMAPLNRLIGVMSIALGLRITAVSAGVAAIVAADELASLNMPLLALRWLAGLIGVAAIIWMTRQTLKIPNTQSATGMLYVGVILTFLGELVAALLSDGSSFPV